MYVIFLFNWGGMDITWHLPPSPFSSVQSIWALKAHPRPCAAVTVIQFQDIIAPKETSCPLAAPEIPPLSAPGNPMGSLISEASCEWQHAAAALHVWRPVFEVSRVVAGSVLQAFLWPHAVPLGSSPLFC